MTEQLNTDVLIIGGGVTGAAIARELSKYDIDTVLIEKEPDLSMGVSKTGHGNISTGAIMAYSLILKSTMAPDAPTYEPESLHMQLLEEGFLMFDELLHNLDVPHKHGGAIIVATSSEELRELERLEELAKRVHVLNSDVRIIDRDNLFEIEPNITREAIAALYDPQCIMDIFPPELVIALAENARNNGVKILLGTEAQRISRSHGVQIVETNNGIISAKFIVNAAGKYVDKVADMAGARDDWGLSFNRSQMIVLDKRLDGLVNNHLHFTPKPGKFGFLAPLHDGNLYIAFGQYEATTDRENSATNREAFDLILAGAKRLVPSISEKDVIASFVGVRVWNTRNPEEHILEASKRNPRFINIAVRMPGYTPAPALAQRVASLLGDQGLQMVRKTNFNPRRQGIPRVRQLSYEKRDALISQDPRYGHVVCRCETVTEGEIVEAINRGATTVQGLQFRTRAGMGRCQSGFCGPRIISILARELGIPVTAVTKKGGASRILIYQSKELLQGGHYGYAGD